MGISSRKLIANILSYITLLAVTTGLGGARRIAPRDEGLDQFRGNHLSNNTCLIHLFFKRGE